MSQYDQSSTRPIEVLKMATDLQARCDAFARDRNQQMSEGEDADGLVSRSTISPTSLESEAAFPTTGNPWHEGWRYPSGYASLELPVAFDMKAPMPVSQTERYRYAGPPEDVHHSRVIAKEGKLPRVRPGYGIVRRPSWEDSWDREYVAGEFPTAPGVVNIPYEPLVAMTEVGAPRTAEERYRGDAQAAEHITRVQRDVRLRRVDLSSAAESHPRSTSLPSSSGTQTPQREAASDFDPFQSSFNPVKGIACGLEELSHNVREAERVASHSVQGTESSDEKASRHDFDYRNLAAAGKIPRAGAVDFPTSEIRSSLRNREASPRGGKHKTARDADGRESDDNNERGLASSDQSRARKRRQIGEGSEDGLGLHGDPLDQPFAPLTAHDWASFPEYFTQVVNPPLGSALGQEWNHRPRVRSTQG